MTSAVLAALLVLVDPGHDVSKPGATSARGKLEYRLNAEVADHVVRHLKSLPGVEVKLTHEYAKSLSPGARGRLANDDHAALLLSIHHDATHLEDDEEWTFEGKAERYSDAGHGFSLHVRGDDPVAVAIARAIAQQLVSSGFEPTTYHANEFPVLDRKLGLYDRRHLAMLNTAKVPTVLLECGFITNKDEELVIEKPETREKIATAIERALKKLPELLTRK